MRATGTRVRQLERRLPPECHGHGDSLVNLRADWKSAFGGPIDVGFYVGNAPDEEYELTIFNIYTSLGFGARTPGEPRNYGVRATYNFGKR